MASGVSEVREVVERVCARPDVMDACRHRDLGLVIDVLGGHGVTQGQIAGLSGISQGRLSEYKKHKRTPRASSIFEAFADGLGMPPTARQALGLSPDTATASVRTLPGPSIDVGLVYPDTPAEASENVVIAATRLRGGNANSARGAARFAAEAIGTARDTGCTGLIVVRADSAYYSAAFCGAVRRAGARFSVTVNMDQKVAAAIATISQDAWTAIRYPRAIWDDQLRCWVSDAQIAKVPYTAFTSKKGQAITARLIVRRVHDLARHAYGKARGATIRRDLIDVAARTARHGRGHLTLHLPAGWHREHEWMTLLTAACGPPPAPT
jgi:transcriptional regulator with XRE-family HTH domain